MENKQEQQNRTPEQLPLELERGEIIAGYMLMGFYYTAIAIRGIVDAVNKVKASVQDRI